MKKIKTRRVTDRTEVFWSRVDKRADGHWLWTGTAHRKHGIFYFNGKMDQAHRISWRLLRGDIPSGLWVLHNCPNSLCLNPDHLRLGTRADNTADAVSRGEMASGDRNSMRLHPELVPRGVKHGMAKLTDEKVLAMRLMCSNGVSHGKISRDFGISMTSAVDAIKGRTWAHVPAAIRREKSR